jgi:DNA repair protein RecO (recombination protein O)
MRHSDRLRTVEAVIISHQNFGEADRLVTLFSREAGKVRGMAKGVRKMGSRKAAYLEPFMHSKVGLAKGKTFWIITQADAIRQFSSISESLEKTGLAGYVMELADRFTIEEDAAPRLFRLIVETLQRIDSHADAFNAILFFELRILDHTGFRPDLTNCVGCAKVITARDQFFSTTQGGVVCPACSGLYQQMRQVSLDALRYLRHFQRSGYGDLADVVVPKEVQDEIAALMSAYLSSIIERRLNAPEFMRQVAHAANNNHHVK